MSGHEATQTSISKSVAIKGREDLPHYCQVEGVIGKKVQFQMRLPLEHWNGKFVVAGCGGFCGAVLPEKQGHSNTINEALKKGYAAITTDSGHQAPNWQTQWAIDDKKALELYAGAWLPLAVASGQQLINQYYNIQPRRTYFSGCSNGGRLGLMAAQRYPKLFDGIAAGGGIFDLTGNAGIHGLWLLQTTRDSSGKAVIDASKVPLLEKAVLEQCDHLDGVSDNIVAKPSSCKPDLASLQCNENADESKTCFSKKEMTAIKRLYQGATANGQSLFPGIPAGSESLWPVWITGTDDNKAWGERAAEGNLRLSLAIPNGQSLLPHNYSLASDRKAIERIGPTINATNPDLSEFKKAGGKLFYYHGKADPLILWQRARQYYDEVVTTMGRQSTDEFSRFFFVPGHGHCWEKPNRIPDGFDPLTIIDQWVESGVAPDEITTVKNNKMGNTIASRKVCAYSKFATLTGKNQQNAEDYQCRTQ